MSVHVKEKNMINLYLCCQEQINIATTKSASIALMLWQKNLLRQGSDKAVINIVN